MEVTGYYIEKWLNGVDWIPCRIVNRKLDSGRLLSILAPCFEHKWRVTIFYRYNAAHNAIKRTRRQSKEERHMIRYRLRVLVTPHERI